ncbi:MAG: electron transfer flavoprotein-ubiquinone oxidoreductase [Deltaproteobacteria bacterium]|nr:electron transfer flavoprotein-ubiquinone oxidoreductase [Deltaproteobacteria bacterium]
MPDYLEQGFPIEFVCDKPQTHIFLKDHHFQLPLNLPEFAKHNYMVASLNKVVKWLAEKCEAIGIDIYSGFAGDQLLLEGEKVVGVRLGDMGIDKDGKQKGTFQAGMDIQAKVTVLGEGVRGSLTKQLISRFGLEGANPQVYETGVKEIWRVKPENHVPGRVVHGLIPHYLLNAFGGMWLYDMQDNLVSFGVVTALESHNPFNDPHLQTQKLKTNPFFRKLFDGAELVRYGAKAIPMGGITSMPKLYTDGAMLVGDSAGFCNAEKLAGVHMAIKSGMMAAEAISDAIAADDFSSVTLGGYAERYRQSWAYEEHWTARTQHASFAAGLPFFFMNEPVRRFLTDGGGLLGMPTFHAGHEAYEKLSELPPAKRVKEEFEFDGVLTFSKEHLVGFSGTAHEADQPSHLVVADTDLCSDVCTEEYGNPCVSFCPAAVYEMMDDPESPGRKQLFIHHENCVHCKTCDIADPYQAITWTPPEGGEGPDYQLM